MLRGSGFVWGNGVFSTDLDALIWDLEVPGTSCAVVDSLRQGHARSPYNFLPQKNIAVISENDNRPTDEHLLGYAYVCGGLWLLRSVKA